MSEVSFRFAKEQDVDKILYFIRQLAKYEKLENEVVATPEILNQWIFEKQKAEVVFCMLEDKEIGFALFFHNFSTFLGKGGLYIEDLFILEEYRGNGYGNKLFKHLAGIAKQRECGRMEWICLDWNTPSIDFYKSRNAVPLDEWTVYRLEGKTLEDI